jgi:quercetin dioxygenase-like cupin family protein
MSITSTVVSSFCLTIALALPPAVFAQQPKAAPSPANAAKATPLMSKDLPDFAGKEVTMSTIEYAPGGTSAPHRHDAHTFVYVLEGSVTMQVAGGEPVTLVPGQTFYETPADVHSISKNASATAPAKFLVFMIKDKGKPATRPAN